MNPAFNNDSFNNQGFENQGFEPTGIDTVSKHASSVEGLSNEARLMAVMATHLSPPDVSTNVLIAAIVTEIERHPETRINPAVARATLKRAASLFGALHTPTGSIWDVRDTQDNLVIGKFIYSSVAGILPGITIEQHGATEHHARAVLGVLDDQYVVDNLSQVQRGRPVMIMGYISGGTGAAGQVGYQIEPSLLWQTEPEAERLYESVRAATRGLIVAGVAVDKPVAMHAELVNLTGISPTRKSEYQLMADCGLPEAQRPRYWGAVYLTCAELLPLNEDLTVAEHFQHDMAFWSKR